MRLPHIPKIDWEPIWKFGTKLVELAILFYKGLEMFNFISTFKADVKKAIADIHERFTQLETKVESLLHPAPVVEEAKPADEDKPNAA
jgi:hypothetical protein